MKTAGIVVLVLAAVGCAGAVGIMLALQHVDPFYAKAMQLDPQKAEAAGRKLEQRVAELNVPTRRDHWTARFTEDEVNGWLAAVLKEKLPDLLPPQVQDPRVQLAEGRLLVGYRYVAEPLATVVTLETAPRVDGEGVVAVRLIAARAGILPVAHSIVVEEVTELAEKLQWTIEWRGEGDTLELVVPMRDLFSTEAERRQLAELEFHDGEVALGGGAEPREDGDSQDAAARAE